jgi:hypothetical protein
LDTLPLCQEIDGRVRALFRQKLKMRALSHESSHFTFGIIQIAKMSGTRRADFDTRGQLTFRQAMSAKDALFDHILLVRGNVG